MKRPSKGVFAALSVSLILISGCSDSTPAPNPLEPVEQASVIPSIADEHNNDVADLTDEMNSAE